MIQKYSYLIFIIVAYFVSALFIGSVIGTEIYHITQHPAFLTDYEFFKEFAAIPGGVGQYLSLFIEQYFYLPIWGVLMLMAEILVSAAMLNTLIKRIFNKEITARNLYWILPLFITVLCCTNVYFAFHVLTQFIITLIIMTLLHLINSNHKLFAFAATISAVAVYHLCGPIYLYTFVISEIIIFFVSASERKVINSACVLAVAVFYPAIIYRLFLALTPKFAFYYPLANRTILELFQPTMFAYYLIIPLSIVIQKVINKVNFTYQIKKGKKEKITKDKTHLIYSLCSAIMLVLLIWAYNTSDNKRERLSSRIAYEGERSNWQKVIELALKSKEYDRNTNFYYDMALALTGQMSNHLFDYPQLLGSEGLLLDEPLAGIICYPTSTLYFNVGQISNSLRYAYESVNYYKDSPYIIRRIIDCLIISGHYTEAEIFLKELSRNMLAKNFVNDRRQFIKEGNSKNMPIEYVRQKQYLAVKWDYIMSPPFRNFEQLMLSNDNNIPATDYLLCYCLLENDLENFVNALLASKYNLKNLPKHYQEAIMVYLSNTANPNPKIQEVVISNDIKQRFQQFANVVNNAGNNAYEIAKQNFANTYWTYYAFENPMSKNFSLKKSQQ